MTLARRYEELERRHHQLERDYEALRAENERLRQVQASHQELACSHERLERENQELRTENERLKLALAKAQKNSSNSSKPPSSDITKPKGQVRQPGKRKKGGQPGHPAKERTPFPPEAVNQTFDHPAPLCPVHGLPGEEHPWIVPRSIQQIIIPDKLFAVHQHTAHGTWCPRCRQVHFASFPPEVQQGGLAGVRLTALAGVLKGELALSYTEIQTFFSDVFGFTLSTGYIAKLIQKNSRAAAAPVEELLGRLPLEARLHVDETSHKENGQLMWTWVFRATLFTCFVIAPSRGSRVLKEMLGPEFGGILACDYFSAYRKFGRDFEVLMQFCLAHLIRDIKFLCQFKDGIVQDYGEELLARVKTLFTLWHEFKSGGSDALRSRLLQAQEEIVQFATSPQEKEAAHPLIQNMAHRFREHGDGYFLFLAHPGVEPTNNRAEQALRFVVLARRKTQGTRGVKGRSFCERLWSIKETCRQHGRSMFQFMVRSVEALFNHATAPSLLAHNTS